MKMLGTDEYEGLKAMAALAAGLLTLLDRIELENDPTLASQRHEMAEAVGLTVTFSSVDVGSGRAQ